ncbi:hypothetical protein ACF05L_03835 [Streptomyces bobili]|uniref:hypothetical protein n=1 Tax=Streptomyces bobili TaxID=67280 RepID=UPI00370115BF
MRTGRPGVALGVSLAAALMTAPMAVGASAEAVAADGFGEVALRLEAPSTFVMYNAEEGAGASNSEFVVPVAVEAGAGGPARHVRVVVDASGLADFLHTYNHHRCHTALGGKPPISRVNNAAGQYS